MEILCVDLAKRTLTKILYRDLARNALLDRLYGDLVRRTETLRRDPSMEGLNIFQKSSVETSYRHLAQIAVQRDLAQQLLQRTCQGDFAQNLLQKSSQRKFAESNPVSFLPDTTLKERVAFRFFSACLFQILTAHCLGSLAGILYNGFRPIINDPNFKGASRGAALANAAKRAGRRRFGGFLLLGPWLPRGPGCPQESGQSHGRPCDFHKVGASRPGPCY